MTEYPPGHRHYKVAPEPLSDEARRILTGGRDEMIKDATSKTITPETALDVEQAKHLILDWVLANTYHPERFIVELAEKLDDVLPRLWATGEETGRQQVRHDPYGYGIGR